MRPTRSSSGLAALDFGMQTAVEGKSYPEIMKAFLERRELRVSARDPGSRAGVHHPGYADS